jgi:hypothetical protein
VPALAPSTRHPIACSITSCEAHQENKDQNVNRHCNVLRFCKRSADFVRGRPAKICRQQQLTTKPTRELFGAPLLIGLGQKYLGSAALVYFRGPLSSSVTTKSGGIFGESCGQGPHCSPGTASVVPHIGRHVARGSSPKAHRCAPRKPRTCHHNVRTSESSRSLRRRIRLAGCCLAELQDAFSSSVLPHARVLAKRKKC